MTWYIRYYICNENNIFIKAHVVATSTNFFFSNSFKFVIIIINIMYSINLFICIVLFTFSRISALPNLQNIFIPSANICYRIPAVVTNPLTNTILLAAERRRPTCDDFNTSHDLVLIRIDKNGTIYDEQVLINDNDAWYNPTFMMDTIRNQIHILINRTPLNMNIPNILLCHPYTRETYILSSSDDGLTWSIPRNISNQVQPADWRCHAVGPGSGIQVIMNPSTNADRLIVPAYHSLCNSTTNTINAQISGVFYSDDGGINWSIGGLLPSNATNECQVTVLQNQTLVMVTRMSIYCNPLNHSEGYCRGISHSNDFGLTWSDFYMNKEIIDPACEGSVINNIGNNLNNFTTTTDSNNNITTLYISVANNPLNRINVSIFISYDQGNTFQYYDQITNENSGYSQLTIIPSPTSNSEELGCFFENGNNGTLSLARIPINNS